ncbi:MAG: hypothetical protein ABJD24_08065 [Acidimicrobiales bacterium]
MGALTLVGVEMRRALRRRAVRALIVLALVGVATLGLVAFFDSAGKSVAHLQANGDHPALMSRWWEAGTGEGVLLIAAIPLLIGALLGGATVAGAEWRAGTITTVLTWEPRRLRLHAARTASAFVLAALIALVLQTLFLASALPAVFAHGSTAGTDAHWWFALFGAMSRIALLTGLAALLGVSLATLGRGTTFALAAAFGWMAVGESIIRGLKPALQHLLIGNNVASAVSWGKLHDAGFTRSGALAMTTLVAYFAVVSIAAAVSFSRRDIAGAS